MQSPVRIEFQGMNPADAVQDKILRYLAEPSPLRARDRGPSCREGAG